MKSRAIAALQSLHGRSRRQLLLVTTLHFAILMLEAMVGHMPILASNWRRVALMPDVWMSVSLLALMAVLLKPTPLTGSFSRWVMLIAAIVGVIGVLLHLAATGVTVQKFGTSWNGIVFHGEPGPTWPLAITIGAVLGLIGTYQIEMDQEFRRVALRGPASWLIIAGYALLVVGIALSHVLALLGWSASLIALAALLLLIAAVLDLTSSITERRAGNESGPGCTMLNRFCVYFTALFSGALSFEVLHYHQLTTIAQNRWAMVPGISGPLLLFSALLLLARPKRASASLFGVFAAISVVIGVAGVWFHFASRGIGLADVTKITSWLGNPPPLAPLEFAVVGLLGLFALAWDQCGLLTLSRPLGLALMSYLLGAVLSLVGVLFAALTNTNAAVFAVFGALAVGTAGYAAEVGAGRAANAP